MNSQKLKSKSRNSLSGTRKSSEDISSTPESNKTTRSKLLTPCRSLGLNRKRNHKVLTPVLTESVSSTPSDSSNDVLDNQPVSFDISKTLIGNKQSSEYITSSSSKLGKEQKTRQTKGNEKLFKPLELRVKLEKLIIESKVPSKNISKRKINQLSDTNKVSEISKKIKKPKYLSNAVGSIADDLKLITQVSAKEDITLKSHNDTDEINLNKIPINKKQSRLPISEKPSHEIETKAYACNIKPLIENSPIFFRHQLPKRQELEDKTAKIDNKKVKTSIHSPKKSKHRARLPDLSKNNELAKTKKGSQESLYNIEEIKFDVANESTSLEKSPIQLSDNLKTKQLVDKDEKASSDSNMISLPEKSQIFLDKKDIFGSDDFCVKRSHHKTPKTTKPQSLKAQKLSFDAETVKSDNNIKSSIYKSQKTSKPQSSKSNELSDEVKSACVKTLVDTSRTTSPVLYGKRSENKRAKPYSYKEITALRESGKYSAEIEKVQYKDYNVKISLDKLKKKSREQYRLSKSRTYMDKSELAIGSNDNVNTSDNSSKQRLHALESQQFSDQNELTQREDCNVLSIKLKVNTEQELQSMKAQKSANINNSTQPSSDKSEDISGQDSLSSMSQESTQRKVSDTKASEDKSEEISAQESLSTKPQESSDANKSTRPDYYNIKTSYDKSEETSEQGLLLTKSLKSLDRNKSTPSDDNNIIASYHNSEEMSEQGSRSTQESSDINKLTQSDDNTINTSHDKSKEMSEQGSQSTQELTDVNKLTESDDYDITVSSEKSQEILLQQECCNIKVSSNKFEKFFEQRLQSESKIESTKAGSSNTKVSLDNSHKNKVSLDVIESDSNNIKILSQPSSKATPKLQHNSNKNGSSKPNKYAKKVSSEKLDQLPKASQESSQEFSDKTETSKLSQVMSEDEFLVSNSDTFDFSKTSSRRKKKKSVTGKHKKHSSKTTVSKQKLDTSETRSVVSVTYDSDSDDDFIAKPRREKRSSMSIKQESNSQSPVKNEGGNADHKKKLKKMKGNPVLDELNKTQQLRIAENKSYTVVYKGNVISYVKSHDNDVDMKTTESDDNQQQPTNHEVPVMQKSMIIERKDYIVTDCNSVTDIENTSGVITSMFDRVNTPVKSKIHVITELKQRKHKKIKNFTESHASKTIDGLVQNVNTLQYKNPCQITTKNPRSLTIEEYEKCSGPEKAELMKIKKEIKTMEIELKLKRDKLESLKRVSVYKKAHNLDDLGAHILQIKRGCQEALIDLLLVLKEHSNAQFDMGTLLHNMKIPNDTVGYNEDEDNFV